LVLQLQRFKLENWVPRKLAIPVSVPETAFDLTRWKGKGLEAGEETLPEDAPTTTAGPTVDQGALDQLMAMGFSENRCRRAIINTSNSGPDAAMEWLLAHMDDPGKLECGGFL
jgi:ubiquitin carboxyl-terminal hydrolase 5/13